MARDRSPTDPPPAKRGKKSSSNTTVASLGDDLLLEVFLRLPSLATLVRAAFTCRAWRRAVATSPNFHRRFRAIHTPPLLGLIFDHPYAPWMISCCRFREIQPRPPIGYDHADDARTLGLPAFPCFVHALGPDRDQAAAAVRGGDFLLTSFQELPGGPHGWEIHDCRGGYVLLGNGGLGTMAVLDPMARRSIRVFDFGHERTLEGHRGFPVAHKPSLLCDDEDPASFRVVIMAHDESRVRATVFSSDTGEWSVLPWVDASPAPSQNPSYGSIWLQGSNMQASGSLFRVYRDGSDSQYVLTLDSATMEFSFSVLPGVLRYLPCSLCVGETKNGTPCLVYIASYSYRVGVLLRTTDSDGVEGWMQDRVASLDTQLGNLKRSYETLEVVAVVHGYAYLATSAVNYFCKTPYWVFSVCLETMKVEKAFQRTYERAVHPCVMAWPPSLLNGNYKSFALEDGA